MLAIHTVLIMDSFTEQEKTILSRFMTNTDKSIFALKNLPEVVMGALFSRYSRSQKSLRRVLFDEFINKPETGFHEIVNYDMAKCGTDELVAIKKAEEFYDRVLVGFGDDSVAELAGAHIAIENVSIIASKVIEDARIGISPLEKSTRYVYFDQKDANGHYLYLDEPTLCTGDGGGFSDLYKRTATGLFDTYSVLIPKISEHIQRKYPKADGVSDRAYTSTVRAKTCDVLRGILPAGTITNLGLFGNGRAFEYLIMKMYAHPLAEIRHIEMEMHEELSKVIPSFVKRANDQYGKIQQNYISETENAISAIARDVVGSTDAFAPANPVTLIHYDTNEISEKKAVAAILYQHSHLSLEVILGKVESMNTEQRKKIIDEYCSRRSNRRHRPGRAFENINYTFDILGNYGMYRDLHRQRVLTQERQLLSTHHGYDLPPEITEFGFENEFRDAMETAKSTFNEIEAKFPHEAQYVVPLAYKIRWYVSMNLREAYHFCELRSMPQGHIDYRRIAQQIYLEIKRVHPNLSAHMKFVDMSEYELERLEAEKSIDKRIEEVKKKYGD